MAAAIIVSGWPGAIVAPEAASVSWLLTSSVDTADVASGVIWPYTTADAASVSAFTR